MMVLASVYLSVSVSLPSTSDIKPVEIWLLFNLAFPFFVMKSNIIQQVEYSNRVIHNLPFIQAIEKSLEKDEKDGNMKILVRPIKVEPHSDSEERKFVKTNKSFLLKLVRINSLYLNPVFYLGFSVLYFLNYTLY